MKNFFIQIMFRKKISTETKLMNINNKLSKLMKLLIKMLMRLDTKNNKIEKKIKFKYKSSKMI